MRVRIVGKGGSRKNNVTSQQMEDDLRSKLDEHGLQALDVIHADPAIAMAWLTGSPLDSEPAYREIQSVIDELERSVVRHG